MNPPKQLTCAASDCSNEFYPVVPQQKFCSDRCCNRENVRLCRARKRRKGGGGNGGGNGGGSGPTLFDTITPVDAGAAFVPIPVIGPSERKPAESVNPETSPAPASKKAAA